MMPAVENLPTELKVIKVIVNFPLWFTLLVFFYRNFCSAFTILLKAIFLDLKLFLFQLNSVKSLSQTLRRYTGLNHLAQAARAVLQNSSQISQVQKFSLDQGILPRGPP